MVFGVHATSAVLDRAGDRVLELWIQYGAEARLSALMERAQNLGLNVQQASAATLSKLAGSEAHQGVVAAVRPRAIMSEAQWLDSLDAIETPVLLLLLDGVTDPHNLGACVRSAAAAGAQAVIVPKDRTAPMTGIAIKAAAGAAEIISVVAVTNLSRHMQALHERQVRIGGLDAHAEQSVFDFDMTGSVALALGAEDRGLRRLTRERCDALVRIPMPGLLESLNVSVAAGIALFEAVRQRTRHLRV